MELQLGLALPTPKGLDFDLNNLGFIDHPAGGRRGCFRDKDCVKNKRGFEQAFGNRIKEESPNLLLWSGQPPNEEEDDHRDQKKINSSPINDDHENDAEKDDEVVGWPPINSWRKKIFHHHHQVGCRINENNRNMGMGADGRFINLVKVKMEGVAIARKIDLRLYHSYQPLTNSLITMFAKDQKWVDEDDYTLTYQDKDGDWLIAGDIPWQTFTRSVQRLKIVRNSG